MSTFWLRLDSLIAILITVRKGYMKTYIAKFTIKYNDPKDNVYRTLIIPAADIETAKSKFSKYIRQNYSYAKRILAYTEVVEIAGDTVILGW